MAKKEPVRTKREVITKKVFISHIGAKYEVAYSNGEPVTCQCIGSEIGLTPTFEPFGIDEAQINKQLTFNLWEEIP